MFQSSLKASRNVIEWLQHIPTILVLTYFHISWTRLKIHCYVYTLFIYHSDRATEFPFSNFLFFHKVVDTGRPLFPPVRCAFVTSDGPPSLPPRGGGNEGATVCQNKTTRNAYHDTQINTISNNILKQYIICILSVIWSMIEKYYMRLVWGEYIELINKIE